MAANRRNFVGADGVDPPFKYFFKAISPEAVTDQKLMIPEKFAFIFKVKLHEVARLKGPDGIVWRVGLSKERGSDRRVWLESGFGDFLRSYSIVPRDLLMFRYDGSSGFKVIICDDTACEVVYRNAEPQVSSSEEDYDEDDMDDSEFDSYDEYCEEEEVVELSESESESLNPRQNIRSANGKGKEVETGHRRRGTDASGSRRRVTGATNRAAGTATAGQGNRGEPRLENSDGSGSDDDWEGGRGKEQIIATGDGASGSRQRRNRSNAPESNGDLWRQLVASKISYSLDFPSLSQGSKRALKEAIHCSNSKRPSVLIAMKLQHLSSRRHLYLPKKFAREHFGEEPERIRLLAYEGKKRFLGETCVRSMWQNGTLFFRQWADFCSNNDELVEGDVCLFELVDKKNKVFNVRIFKA